MSSKVPIELSLLDLADPRLHADADLRPTWQILRAEAPIFWHSARGPNPGFWVLSRYADQVAVYQDSRRFASSRGNMLPSLLRGGDSGGGRMLPVTDDPQHRKLRAAMTPAFLRGALKLVGGTVRESALRLVRTAAARTECDFVRDVAAHIPLAVICDLLGVPERDREQILGLTSLALSAEQPNQQHSETVLVRNELLMYFTQLARNRRNNPGTDLISRLTTNSGLTDEEVLLNCYALVLGGDETARLSIAGAVRALCENPLEWQRLKHEEVSLASATEEVLRWTTPALHTARTATKDVTLRGQPIRSGDIVTLWTCSANLDETEFDSPERFDLSRSPNRHLTFGYGKHFCVGAQLSRIEIEAVLRALRDTVDEILPAGTPKPIYSNFLSGVSSLPVSLRARDNSAN